VIVNIDGFNEVALGYHNLLSGIDYSLPSAHVLLPLVRMADVSAQYDYLVAMVKAMRSHRLLMECEFKKNLAKYTITHQLYSACSTWANRGLLNANAQLESYGLAHREDVKDGESIYTLNFRDRGPADRVFFTAIADQWANSSVLMSKIAQSNNAGYVHIIQPNQHYSRHRFDDHEKAVAFKIAQDDAFVVGARHGYPALLNAMSKVMRGGLNVHSAIDIFDNIEEHVYADECCHYNARGESLLADFVAVKIIEELCRVTKSESCHNDN
jgi:hypothetical protein